LLGERSRSERNARATPYKLAASASEQLLESAVLAALGYSASSAALLRYAVSGIVRISG
jgi:hypothetical protein